ncbi:unnamed protein product [Protopolystoma xenopodis]|uniref:Uncharacterized protein n=1 Tax=Protopolystoma xenopodis TaxID=117903 RepID=A0A3S5CME5_9PLAT|nr:unnamed protein product [Protopolystoma xenopodis]
MSCGGLIAPVSGAGSLSFPQLTPGGYPSPQSSSGPVTVSTHGTVPNIHETATVENGARISGLHCVWLLVASTGNRLRFETPRVDGRQNDCSELSKRAQRIGELKYNWRPNGLEVRSGGEWDSPILLTDCPISGITAGRDASYTINSTAAATALVRIDAWKTVEESFDFNLTYTLDNNGNLDNFDGL